MLLTCRYNAALKSGRYSDSCMEVWLFRVHTEGVGQKRMRVQAREWLSTAGEIVKRGPV